ncbi:MAG: [acyl-carrier-protein] S-malonyltransferase [Flavobacteriales bacterium]|jgi:[acyl-carrier-protein] S-malonyltransferase
MSINKLAFVFPGQGSQKVGMLNEVANEYSIIQQTFAEASDVLGYDLWALVQQGPQEGLNLTEKTQPLLLSASVALWRLWQQQGLPQPEYLAGHSLGEFTALVCAQSLQFCDAIKLVQQRGQFMQSAVPVGVGAMAAIIGLEDDKINQACSDAAQGECVAAVNYNSPGQVVIAGKAEAVERAIEACKAAGAKRAMPLPVSAPFHTDLMQPAGEKLREAIAGLTIAAPKIPVIHNVYALTESDPAKIADLLVQQISSPVQWVSCVKKMSESGVTYAVECGPGNVLSGLMRRIDKSIGAGSIDSLAGFEKVTAAIAEL